MRNVENANSARYRYEVAHAGRPLRARRLVPVVQQPVTALSSPPPTPATAELLPEAIWQRCYVHFLRSALDYLPRRADDDCMQELRWLYDRRDLRRVPRARRVAACSSRRIKRVRRRDLATWLKKWQHKFPRLCDWVENNIEETLSFYQLPGQHHKHMKSTNMLETLDEQIKRRTHVVRVFPNRDSCLRLIRALAIETHENLTHTTVTAAESVHRGTRGLASETPYAWLWR